MNKTERQILANIVSEMIYSYNSERQTIGYGEDRMYRRYERMKAKFKDYIVVGMPEMDVLPEQEQEERKAGTYKRTTFTGSFIGEDL